jgi:hypothetical protein
VLRREKTEKRYVKIIINILGFGKHQGGRWWGRGEI